METMVVLGASPNPERYSCIAVKSLLKRNYDVVAIGRRQGEIQNISILTDKPYIKNVHTILMYVGVKNQPEYYDYILKLNPKRIIFNPGTENYELGNLAAKNNIECVFECALVMLNDNTF
jgi:predicted CoA-binding protein